MFEIIPPGHVLRPKADEVIRAAFLRDHGAVLADLPRLLVAEHDGAEIACAASLRFDADGFFSERYLDDPIEQLVTRHAGIRALRGDLAEVGSLAAARPGAVCPLVGGIIALLRAQGVRWAFFTATARLRTLLRRADIPLIELAAADPARIPHAERWGGYYRQDPRVMLVGDYMVSAPFPQAPSPERRHA